ncbi:Symplekin [Grifola frondosa]|uniref:Symplekin n=1 Tax=Grifola frondosa TaxID=5627 RepID=A0A1C7MBP6_GRIFR|nr:Symplekin [Grifola frondosa]
MSCFLVASQSLETLAGLLNDPNLNTVKVVVQCFPTVYALLFRMLCANRNMRQQWDVLNHAKSRILEFVWSPHTSNGVKLSAVKFMQRLQNKNDPNLSMCPTDHPFISVPALEAEGLKLLEGVITILYTSNNVDMLSAILNSWASLTKLRPTLVELVVSTLAQWTPSKLEGLPASTIKSVEKSLRILLTHISRCPQDAPFSSQIHAALSAQGIRMDQAAAEEKQRKAAAVEASRKRAPSATPVQEAPDMKRPKLEHDAAASLAGFDFTALPTNMITDIIVANLQSFSEAALVGLVQAYRQSKAPSIPGLSAPTSALPATAATYATVPPVAPKAPPTGPPCASRPSSVAAPRPSSAAPSEPRPHAEPTAPLPTTPPEIPILSGGQEVTVDGEVALDQEMDLSPDLHLAEFKLPPPKELSADDREALIRKSISRIWDSAKDLVLPEAPQELSADVPETIAADMSMLLLVRLITRVTDPNDSDEESTDKMDQDGTVAVSEVYAHQDRLRHILCDYIMADFSGRIRLATAWMNEEWYNDQIRSKDPNWQPNYEMSPALNLSGETTLSFIDLKTFISVLPTDGKSDLRRCGNKVTRGAAINTVKRWIPDANLWMSRPSTEGKVANVQTNGHDHEDHDENMEDGQLPPEDIIQTPYLPEQLELPANQAQILQHLELLVRSVHQGPGVPRRDICCIWRNGRDSTRNHSTADHSSHPADGPSAQLVALVKALINERDLDARFLIPIIAEMDKADILRHLPRIVSILNGEQEPKNLTFGSVTSNLPRVRQSELLTPAELMVLLHESEKEIGMKSAMEAIGICFSMTDIFRSEILAVVMNQLVDEPVLPTLFLRTVIQAVKTYRSLVGFVSTTLLSRLITKKIWTNPHLWEGFIRCAKLIAPASFGALLQLPKDQLRELVDKQPSLKAGLRDYVMKKAGNKARVAGFLDIFGEDDGTSTPPAAPDQMQIPVTPRRYHDICSRYRLDISHVQEAILAERALT